MNGSHPAPPAARKFEKVYVWETPVRLTHWVTAAAITVLMVTGLYIAWPYAPGSGFLMRWMIVAHYLAGYTFTASLALRIYWSFHSNYYASFKTFFPAFSKEGRARMLGSIKYYLFLSRRVPADVGHNALASTAYTGIFVLFATEIITGFAMMTYNYGGIWSILFGWVFAIAPNPVIRTVHYIVMWALMAFVIQHIYSAALFDIEEGSGIISSMVTGFKTVKTDPRKLRQ